MGHALAKPAHPQSMTSVQMPVISKKYALRPPCTSIASANICHRLRNSPSAEQPRLMYTGVARALTVTAVKAGGASSNPPFLVEC